MLRSVLAATLLLLAATAVLATPAAADLHCEGHWVGPAGAMVCTDDDSTSAYRCIDAQCVLVADLPVTPPG